MIELSAGLPFEPQIQRYREYMRQQQSSGRASFGDVFADKLGKGKGRDR